ncbi:MAG: ABC transporter ATP-binding protein [Clostridia bacterium]|nr:ABC transporter ATP-binding protein [Clostridia bacterium]MBR6753302.1 ABC transporter ATP-binding protein [Clostridia bacterium]
MKDIYFNNISKSFDEKPVLQDFCLTLPAGRRTCIMGPSGCGKTTLLHILTGLVKPDTGTVENRPDRIGMVFQENRLCEDFSALENVRMVALDKTEQARALLTRMGLAEDMMKPVSTLSGGMKRRVSIARALLFDAPLIVMDEPFKGLDEDTKETVMQLVLSETEDKTLLFITHDEKEAQHFADTVITMKPL